MKEIVKQRLQELTDICKLFVDAILRSVNELPYGLRWICKQVFFFFFFFSLFLSFFLFSYYVISPPLNKQNKTNQNKTNTKKIKKLSAISKEALPDSTVLDIHRLIGYFVYYHFLNLAIVTPDSKQAQLVKKELSPLGRKR